VEVTPRLKVGDGEKLLLIAGPCQIESYAHCLEIALFLQDLCRKYPANLVFKASFDKANRTSLKGRRGPGLKAGLDVLAKVKQTAAVAVLTDVHEPAQAAVAAEVADIIQIPAFLCRQTDLLLAAGATGKTVNLKKGQFLAPQDMQYAAEKIASTGNQKILLCERGSCFGYRDLVVDMRALLIMKESGYPVIFDASHSVQLMGGAQGTSGGQRQFIIPLARAATAVGIDGIFVECHDRPEQAPSDGPNMLPLSAMPELLQSICRIRQTLCSAPR